MVGEDFAESDAGHRPESFVEGQLSVAAESVSQTRNAPLLKNLHPDRQWWHDQGYKLVPCYFMDKFPAITRWKPIAQKETQTQEEVESLFPLGATLNTAAIIPLDKLVLDIENKDAESKLLQAIPELKNTLSRTTGNGGHYEVERSTCSELKMGMFFDSEGKKQLEIRTSKPDRANYCIVPPSTHPNGKKYEFINKTPAIEIPNLGARILDFTTENKWEFFEDKKPRKETKQVARKDSLFNIVKQKVSFKTLEPNLPWVGEEARCECPKHVRSETHPNPCWYNNNGGVDGHFRCHSLTCGERGDIIHYYALKNRISETEACKKLAELYGIEIPASYNSDTEEIPYRDYKHETIKDAFEKYYLKAKPIVSIRRCWTCIRDGFIYVEDPTVPKIKKCYVCKDEKNEPVRNHYEDKVTIKKTFEIVPIESEEARKTLYYLAALNDGRGTAESINVQKLKWTLGTNCIQNSLELRIRKYDDKHYINYGGGESKVIEITPDGWSVKDADEIEYDLFYKTKKQLAWEIAEEGDSNDFIAFANKFNVPEEQRALLLGDLGSALIHDIPQAIDNVTGSQGSAKSSFSKALKQIVDPSTLEAKELTNETDLLMSVKDEQVCVFDNVNHLLPEKVDQLCRLCTGEGITRRLLYTNSQTEDHKLKRKVIVNGINIVSQQPDYLERSVFYNLEPIAKDKRLTESQLKEELAILIPRVRRYLLDLFVEAISFEKQFKATQLPRLADYAKWGSCFCKASKLFKSDDCFIEVFNNNQLEKDADFIENNVLARSFYEWCKERPSKFESSTDIQNKKAVFTWKGNATTLLSELKHIAVVKDLGYENDPTFPKTGQQFSNRINSLIPVLKTSGITIIKPKGTGTRNSKREYQIATADLREEKPKLDNYDGSDASDALNPIVTYSTFSLYPKLQRNTSLASLASFSRLENDDCRGVTTSSQASQNSGVQS